MSNWPLIAATRTETLGGGTGTGTVVTASATANTKGSYATIGTAGFRYSGFMLCIAPTPSSGVKRYRLDVAINTGGSDTIIVEDVFFDGHVNNPISVYLPVRVPSGATLKARVQSQTGSENCWVTIVGFAQDFPGVIGASRVLSCTDFTNTQPANTVTQTGTSYTAWTTIRSSMPARVSRLWVSWSAANDASRTASDFLVDIGIGAAAAEVVLATLPGQQSGAAVFPLMMDELLCDIPAGARLAFRIQCSASGAADSFGVAAMGLVA